MDYEKDTRLAYRDAQKARNYQAQQTTARGWVRFTTLREQLWVKKALRQGLLTAQERVLDIPCGTGILACVLANFPCRVVAADISREMMALAPPDYQHPGFLGFVQADIVQAPFRPQSFSWVISVGLMHRLPENIRKEVLKWISYLSKKHIIISYSFDSPFQRFKHWLIKKVKPSHKPAPAP